jgi:hypothetical protein
MKSNAIEIEAARVVRVTDTKIEAVEKWKFHPATRDDKPVPVQINVEVNFRLY